jgi:hypothetical protein
MSHTVSAIQDLIRTGLRDADPMTPRFVARSILKDILSDAFPWQGIRHPTGFVVIPVYLAGGQMPFRLHLWPVERKTLLPLGCAIHDHVWDMTSAVVCGELDNREFVADLERGSGLYKLYHVEYIDAVTSVMRSYADTARLRCTKHERHAAGTKYQVTQGTLHESISCSTQMTVTIVETRTGREGSPLVASVVDLGREIRVVREVLGVPSLRQLARVALESIGSENE